MVDFSRVQVRRLKDKASPNYIRMRDYIWTWCILRNSRIKAGKSVIFKKDVKISICKTGVLVLGDHSFFNENCFILLTMPHPIVEIGKWVFVGRNTIIASKNSIKIGDYTSIAPNCYFIDHEHGLSKDEIILNQKSVLKKITIGKDCFFGTGAIILGGVNIGDGSIIGAGSVVTKDIPPYQIWAGNPARFIKMRE